MTIAPGQIRAVVHTVHPDALSIVHAETILELAQLAVDADGREDADEIATFFAIGACVFALAGIAGEPTPTFVSDEDELPALANKLDTTPARELAYVAACLLTHVDQTVAPEEHALVERLREALAITPGRAGELAAVIRAGVA